MRRKNVVFACLLTWAAISVSLAIAEEPGGDRAILEGVLRVHPKFLYKYYIECKGTAQQCALRNSDALEKITPGSHIRANGRLGTFHHAGSTMDNPSPFPSAWVIYMDVEKVTVLRQAKVEQLIKPATSLHHMPTLSLQYLCGGDLGNKYVNSVITIQDVSRVIVLENDTSAPDENHLYEIERVIRTNPVIQSFYYINPNTGKRIRSHKEVEGFFTALLLIKDERCVGFDVSREKVRIFNSEGDGWVLRDSVQARHGRTEVHTVLEILDRPTFFNARPAATRISFDEYEKIKADFVSRNPRWEPKYALTYRDKEGSSYSLRLESFCEEALWLAHLKQGRGKGWDWVARYELARSRELDEEFRIPQILERRSRIIGGVQYGMAVSDVIANKGEPKEIVHHKEAGSAHFIYEDVKVYVRQWHPLSGRGRVVRVTSMVK